MDSLFECGYVRTPEMEREFYRYWFFGRPVMIVLYSLMLLSFLINVLHLIFYFNPNEITIVLFWIPIFFGMMYWLYRKTVATARKRDLEVANGKNIEVKIAVTPEKIIQNVSTGAMNELPLSSIKKAVVLKTQIVLISEAKILYTFRKDSFTKGTAEDFVFFLTQRRIYR